MTYFLAAVSSTLALDLIWFFIFVSDYSNNKTSLDEGAMSFFRMITLVFSFVNFFFKFAVIGSMYLLKITPSNHQHFQVFNNWDEQGHQ